MSVIDILHDSSLGKLHKLSNSLCADYMFIFNENSTMCLPFKYLKETEAGMLNFYSKTYVYVIEFIDPKAIILVPNDITFDKIRATSLKNNYNLFQTDKIVIELQKYKDYYKKIDDVQKDTKRKQLTREDNLKSSKDTNKLEADAHKEFVEIMPNNIKRTTEACLADWVYYKDDLSKTIPVQTKSATIRSVLNTYIFRSTNKYPEMLLVCRPMPKTEAGIRRLFL